jgi:hypothetical protein
MRNTPARPCLFDHDPHRKKCKNDMMMTAHLANVDGIFGALLGLAFISALLLDIPIIWSSTAFVFASTAVGAVLGATAI